MNINWSRARIVERCGGSFGLDHLGPGLHVGGGEVSDVAQLLVNI
jgi:hypothetical protein